ncbi:MAG: hypothetical protein M3077_14140 [Candidatus Dormibacteraeota bacterium]|nr:hypothetical protein [Candidatus Dormibacteraeota bacterium]
MDLLFYPVMLAAILAPTLAFSRRHDLLDALALGATASVTGCAVLAFGRFLLLLPASSPRTVGLVTLGIVLVCGCAFVIRLTGGRSAASHPGPPASMMVLVLVGAALGALGVEAIVPHFGIANSYYDWWEHFDLARFYLAPGDLFRHYLDGYGVTSRTPVYNLATSLALSLFGDRFSVFQVATAALAWLWVMPAMLLALRFLHDQGIRLVALLAVSPLILFATTYGWPKGLVTFFALLALDRFLALRQAAPGDAVCLATQFGLAGGMTLMTHQGFIGYLLPLYGLLAWDAFRRRRFSAPLAIACTVSALVALPWYAWATAQYGLGAALVGYPLSSYATPMLWLVDHLIIVVSSAVPLGIPLRAFGATPLQEVFIAYLRTAVGLLGVAFFLRLLARAVGRSQLRPAGFAPVIGFACSGIVTTTLLLNGWGNGWASADSVFLPAMLALVVVALARAPLTEGMIRIALAECLVVLAAAIIYLWSPASLAEPNARLAVALRVPFLGHDVFWFGIGLVLLAVALSLMAIYGLRVPLAQKKSPAPGGARLPDLS